MKVRYQSLPRTIPRSQDLELTWIEEAAGAVPGIGADQPLEDIVANRLLFCLHRTAGSLSTGFWYVGLRC